MCSRDLFELARTRLGQAVIAQPQRADQRAMDDQIGIAADRRGEMRVAAQVQAEMAEILGAYSACACVRRTTSLTSSAVGRRRASRPGCG